LIRRDQVPPNRKLLGRIAQELETKQIRHMAFLANHYIISLTQTADTKLTE